MGIYRFGENSILTRQEKITQIQNKKKEILEKTILKKQVLLFSIYKIILNKYIFQKLQINRENTVYSNFMKLILHIIYIFLYVYTFNYQMNMDNVKNILSNFYKIYIRFLI